MVTSDGESAGKVVWLAFKEGKALIGKTGLVDGHDLIIGAAREKTASRDWGV